MWVGKTVDCLRAEYTAHRVHSAALPLRTGKRLAAVLERAAATAAQEHSVVARRLQSVSSNWRQEIARRKSRCVRSTLKEELGAGR